MADESNTALLGFGVDSVRLLALAELTGLPLWSRHGVTGLRHAIVLWGAGAVPAGVDDPWRPPATAWIEADGYADPSLVAAIDRSRQADLFASFTTATANTLPIAGSLIGAVCERHPVPVERREDLELALHEAISNAIIHGNLNTPSFSNLSVRDLDDFSASLALRLTDPRFAQRRIEIRVSIRSDGFIAETIDEGSGFDAEVSERPAAEGKPCGRGLDLIASIARSYRLLDRGRRLSMEFSW